MCRKICEMTNLNEGQTYKDNSTQKATQFLYVFYAFTSKMLDGCKTDVTRNTPLRWDHVCRGDVPHTRVNFQSYASILANLGNPQEDGHTIPPGENTWPPHPPKCSVQMIYDLTRDFPNLPPHHQQQAQNKQTATDNPTTIISDSSTYERPDGTGRGSGGG
jgi:hypothetical protein